MKLTEKQMTNIIDNKLIDEWREDEKEQVLNFAFGKEYMESLDKLSRKRRDLHYRLCLESLSVNLVKSDKDNDS